MQKVQCEILGLSSSPSTGGAYAILLKEMEGNKRLPIIIGAFEAQAIALEIEGIKPPRPLTHDLLKQLTDSLGASVLEVSGFSQEIDARPSDAIALAVRTQAPIYVSSTVLDSAAYVPSEETEDAANSNIVTGDPKDKKPLSKDARLAALQNKLREAIEGEEYERAARIRDEIKNLASEN